MRIIDINGKDHISRMELLKYVLYIEDELKNIVSCCIGDMMVDEFYDKYIAKYGKWEKCSKWINSFHSIKNDHGISAVIVSSWEVFKFIDKLSINGFIQFVIDYPLSQFRMNVEAIINIQQKWFLVLLRDVSVIRNLVSHTNRDFQYKLTKISSFRLHGKQYASAFEFLYDVVSVYIKNAHKILLINLTNKQ